jgi:hypothetical protein
VFIFEILSEKAQKVISNFEIAAVRRYVFFCTGGKILDITISALIFPKTRRQFS